MCIIHNCLTAPFAAYRLESAGNAGVCRQPCHDFLYGHTEQNTRPCRTQCVVYAEPSGRMQVYRIPLALPEHIKCRTVCGNVNAFRRQISLAVHADCQLLHICACGIIHIDDAFCRACEKHPLCRLIVFHCFMIIQMILCQVRENCHIKGNSVYPVQIQRMRGNLHHNVRHILILHPAKERLQLLRFGRCPLRLQHLIADAVFNRADNAHLFADSVQNGFHQIGGRGFAICACHADDIHLCGGVSVEMVGKQCQRNAVIFRHKHRYAFGYVFHPVLTQKGSRPLFQCHGNIFVSVRLKSCNADKQTVFFYLAGIVLEIGNFHIRRSLLYLIRNTL